MSLSLRFAAGSHNGMIRDHNEDSGYAGPRLLAIADGMGGQAAGEVASAEVISTLVQLDDDIPGSDILTSLGAAVQRANEQLRAMVADDAQLEGMGTTLTALLWTGQRLGLVHVGDSRAYLLRDGTLTQITQDHTWVQRLVDEGRITEEEATTHPQRSLLMRALGSGDRVDPDLSIREVRAGDRYLLCSDGLSGVVSHETMEEALASYQAPQETVQELIQLALRGGGPDNITCIVADVLDTDDADALAGELNDTPVVVGAVAEVQHQLADARSLQSPAGRAAELGRNRAAGQPAPGPAPQEGFGPPGSGTAMPAAPPEGAFGALPAADLTKPPGRRRPWIKWTLVGVLGLAVIGGGLYGGYRWTQSQYFIGANGGHVAIYRGIDQDLAWIDLSTVHSDHPEIELKYLPTFQKNQIVKETIPVNGLKQAEEKIEELAEQAEVCRIVAEGDDARKEDARQSGDGAARKPSGHAGESPRPDQDASGHDGATGTDMSGGPSDQGADTSVGARSVTSPSPGAGLTEEQQRLAKQCTRP